MNRRVVMNSVIGGAFGMACAIVGFPWNTWQFWLLFGLFIAAVINSLIESPNE